MNKRRKFVFDELFRLVCDFDDAMLASGVESDWDVDHELGAMLIRLNGETRRIRKLKTTEYAEAA